MNRFHFVIVILFLMFTHNLYGEIGEQTKLPIVTSHAPRFIIDGDHNTAVEVGKIDDQIHFHLKGQEKWLMKEDRLEASGSNLFIGTEAGGKTTSGENTFIGHKAGVENMTANHNTFVGASAGENTISSDNTFIGVAAGKLNTTSAYNTHVGSGAGFGFTGQNPTDPCPELYTKERGSYNSFFGFETGFCNKSNKGSYFGYRAGYLNIDGQKNSYFGNEAGFSNKWGNFNNMFGVQAGRGVTGDSNCFFGFRSGEGFPDSGVVPLPVVHNSFFGDASGRFNQGSDNSFFGSGAGSGSDDITYKNSGTNNTFIGRSAGSFNDTGSFNTFIGDNSGGSGAKAYSYSSVLGADTQVTASNQIRLGNYNTRSIGGYLGWTTLSDESLFEPFTDIPNVPGLDFITKLEPITYKLKDPPIKYKISGFRPKDVEAAAIAASYEFSGLDAPEPGNPNDYYGLRLADFVPALVKAVQELDQKVKLLEQQLMNCCPAPDFDQ